MLGYMFTSCGQGRCVHSVVAGVCECAVELVP